MPKNYEHQHRSSPELRGWLAAMDEIMEKEAYNTVATPSDLIIKLFASGEITSMAQFELGLRDVGSRVHLIAVPLDLIGDKIRTIYPAGPLGHPDNNGSPEYTLLISLNGPQEASEILDQFGATPEENLARLDTTGISAL